jgi:RNA polymerase sigma-70 factor (ECF subfamily)
MKNKSDAEDITQEIFLKLIEKPRTFESSEHEKAWLIRVAVNLCKDRLKMSWFRKTVKLDECIYGTTPEKREILYAVMKLPVKYRSIIFMFYYENYSIKEIAEIMGIKEGTVGSRLHRARNLLKNKLKEDFEYE